MEFCEYSLKDIIVMKNTFNSSLNETNYYISCELFREIVECVQYLNSRKPRILHRHLNPGNILITAEPNNKRFVKLCDFGIAVNHKTKSMNSNNSKSQIHTPKCWNAWIYGSRQVPPKCEDFGLEKSQLIGTIEGNLV